MVLRCLDSTCLDQVASSVGVRQFVVPGSTVEDSRGALDLALQKPNVSKILRAAFALKPELSSTFSRYMDSSYA